MRALDDRLMIVANMAAEKGVFPEYDECKAIIKALEGRDLTPDAVVAAAAELWPDHPDYRV